MFVRFGCGVNVYHLCTHPPDSGRYGLVVSHHRHGRPLIYQLHERLLFLLHVQHIAHLAEGKAEHEDLVFSDIHREVANVHHRRWIAITNVQFGLLHGGEL